MPKFIELLLNTLKDVSRINPVGKGLDLVEQELQVRCKNQNIWRSSHDGWATSGVAKDLEDLTSRISSEMENSRL